jgi:GDPmannose 4,6-dehydratase
MQNYALITGITGQDGSYLAELLIEKNYIVHGIVRRTSLLYSNPRIEHIRDKLVLHYGDMTDGMSLLNIVSNILSKDNLHVLEIYNLAAQSHVAISFENAEYTSIVDGIGVLKLLEIIKNLPSDVKSKVKFYQAGTSEMYGKVYESPQNEITPFNPVSPYACSKVYAYYITKNYRLSYNIFACNGILFNHESPRRGKNFVTMKIINGIKDILDGKIDQIKLGNIDSMRDWGHTKDYVYGMWLMMQHKTPDDYVLATGVATSVRSFVSKAFNYVNIPLKWKHSGVNEIGYVDSRVYVSIDTKYYRPCEVDYLCGDCNKAKSVLHWEPEYDIDMLIEDMFKC